MHLYPALVTLRSRYESDEPRTLSKHLNRLSKCTPRLAMDTVSVRRGDHIRAGLVNFRMDHESCLVDRQLGTSFSDISLVIHKDKVRGFDSREMLSKGVHPEMVLQDRIYIYQYHSLEG